MTPIEIDWTNITLNDLRVTVAENEAAKLQASNDAVRVSVDDEAAI